MNLKVGEPASDAAHDLLQPLPATILARALLMLLEIGPEEQRDRRQVALPKYLRNRALEYLLVLYPSLWGTQIRQDYGLAIPDVGKPIDLNNGSVPTSVEHR